MAQTPPFVTNSTSSTPSTEPHIIAINANAQLLYKLTSNFPAWHAQLDSLGIGYDLQGFITGSNPCPILETLQEKLGSNYTNCSRTRVMQVKDTLTSLSCGSKSATDYLQQVKSTSDELALIDSPLTNDDLMLCILNGLESEFRDIASSIRTHENPLTFDELPDLLVRHESYLHHLETLS
ncbi:uncharacterized protein LOC122316628 [Carya illinoinensis]|uniref:uncharacterized protein LOC122316628 n=1 Tax=Carya illinoinensis TaxID=32201 RepID=UPI001C71A902|nr:uncharacterized protein LOC122316628 [Carya illinoinensis]